MLTKILRSVLFSGKTEQNKHSSESSEAENNSKNSKKNNSKNSKRYLNKSSKNNKPTNSDNQTPTSSIQANMPFNFASPDIPEYKLGKTENFHYNFCWLLGRRQTQEDAHMADSLGHGCYIFGIFDGHGNSIVSNKVAQMIPSEVKTEMKKHGADIEKLEVADWETMIKTVFQRIDKLQKVLLNNISVVYCRQFRNEKKFELDKFLI